MIRMSAIQGRKERLELIIQTLRENNGSMLYPELYSHFVMSVTRRKFWEYLNELRHAKLIEFPALFPAENSLVIKLVEKTK